MKYNTQDKFTLGDKKINIEIIGRFPAGQINNIATNGQNFYRVSIDGMESYMAERVIEELFTKVVIAPINEPAPIITSAESVLRPEPVKEMPEIKIEAKKAKGRPKGKKVK